MRVGDHVENTEDCGLLSAAILLLMVRLRLCYDNTRFRSDAPLISTVSDW